MYAVLHPILGKYTYQFIVQTGAFPIMLFSMALFSSSLKRRKLFPVRVLLGLGIILAGFVGVAVLRTEYAGIFSRLIANYFISFITLPLLFWCYGDSAVNIMLCWCAGVVSQEISGRFFDLLLSLAGVDTQVSISFFSDYNLFRDMGISYLVRGLICLACFACFRKNRCLEADAVSARNIMLLSVFSTVWIAILNSVTREYQSESRVLYQVIQAFLIVYDLFILLLRTGILSINQYRREIALMDQVLYEERKQYQSSKENIDIINMKCHDLKHQLSDLSGKLTDQEIRSLQEAVKIYDSNIKTGSEVLDVLLYEKQLVCKKDGISLTCMADGKALGFMRTTHIYSLFNNALGNALEAVRSVPDPQMRIVNITVAQNAGAVEIEVSNYFQGERTIQNGMPVTTTKKDQNHHGFGMMSMKYVAEQYGGKLQTSAEGSIFTLRITIPVPNKETCISV